jgi:hypothetical protein
MDKRTIKQGPRTLENNMSQQRPGPNADTYLFTVLADKKFPEVEKE